MKTKSTGEGRAGQERFRWLLEGRQQIEGRCDIAGHRRAVQLLRPKDYGR